MGTDRARHSSSSETPFHGEISRKRSHILSTRTVGLLPNVAVGIRVLCGSDRQSIRGKAEPISLRGFLTAPATQHHVADFSINSSLSGASEEQRAQLIYILHTRRKNQLQVCLPFAASQIKHFCGLLKIFSVFTF